MGEVSIAVVTSCSLAGFEQHGRRNITTLDQFWPADVNVYMVSEDNLQIPKVQRRTIEFLPLGVHASATEFYEKHADNARAKGITGPTGRNGYAFRFDAWKFSKKVFAISLVASQTKAKRLIWLDADVFTFAPLPLFLLQALPPPRYALAYLDRGVKYHSECGFVSYDLTHPQTKPFIAEFERLYVSGEVFGLKEWHDSFVFDWLRKRTGIPCYKIPHGGQGHPFVHSLLGKYMDHLKGRRKEHGQSRDHPFLRKRSSKFVGVRK